MRLATNIAVGFALALLWSCGAGTPTGAIHVRAASPALLADPRVSSLFIQVFGVDNGWPGIQGAAYNAKADNSGEWSFEVDEIPVGRVTLYAEARDSNGRAIFVVPEPRPIVRVVAHATAEATLNLQEAQPRDPYSSTGPYISSLTTTAQNIDRLTTISLAATVIYAGDLHYQWTDHDGGGTFTAPDALQTQWTPPGDGTFVVGFTATDDDGCSAGLDVTINVAAGYGQGAIAVIVDLNNWPVIHKIVPRNAQGRVGQLMELTAAATDADDDHIKFTWHSECGSFQALEQSVGPAATMMMQESRIGFIPAAEGLCTITVTVEDFSDEQLELARNGRGTGTFTFNVGHVAAAVGPQFYVRVSSPTGLEPGHRAEVQVIPASGHAEPAWTFRWSDGGFGGSFQNREIDGFTDGSDSWYYPPSCDGRTGEVAIPISVLVTDTSTNATNSESFALKLRCAE